jgi:hypothetical protein
MDRNEDLKLAFLLFHYFTLSHALLIRWVRTADEVRFANRIRLVTLRVQLNSAITFLAQLNSPVSLTRHEDGPEFNLSVPLNTLTP